MKNETLYTNSLYDYLESLSARADEARTKKIFALSTPEEASGHCAQVKQALKNLMEKDSFPKGTTLPQVVATIRKNGVLID